MNKSLSKKIFIISLLVFLLMISLSVFFIFYINKLSDEILVIREDASVIQNNDITSLKLKLSKLAPDISKVDSYFIDSDNVAIFLDTLDVVGLESGGFFEIQNVDLEDNPEDEDDYIKTLNIVTQNKGSWDNVINYLLSVEKLNKKVFVDSLRLSAVVDPETGAVSWNLVTNLKGIAK